MQMTVTGQVAPKQSVDHGVERGRFWDLQSNYLQSVVWDPFILARLESVPQLREPQDAITDPGNTLLLFACPNDAQDTPYVQHVLDNGGKVILNHPTPEIISLTEEGFCSDGFGETIISLRERWHFDAAAESYIYPHMQPFLRLNPQAGQILSRIGGNPDLVLGKRAAIFAGDPLKGRELVNPNYGVFDSEGNFYYTDSGDYFNPTGSILVVRPDGTTELFHEGPLEFPNGLAIDAEEKYLYVALSTAPNISRLPLRGGSAKIKPEVYVPLVDVVPDGMAFDDRGRMVISCYVPDRIYLAGTDGKAEILREDPGAELLNRPTNVALRDHKVYYANLGGWHVGAFDFDAGPMPLRYPKLR